METTQMTLNTEKINLRIPTQLKTRLEETGNTSEYVRESVERRLLEFHEAVELLEGTGWKRNEIRAVMDVLNGTFFTFSLPYTQQIADNMADAAELDETHKAWGIEKRRWEILIEKASHEPTARALRAVATEFWSQAGEHAQDVI